jgi:putative ABC transport system permease protein
VFAHSVDAFTHTPARYGIGFDISIELPTNGSRAILDQLAADHDLAAVAATYSGTVDIDGRPVTAYGLEPKLGTLLPTLRAGTLPAHDDEIALGPKLLGTLHKHIGDTVTVGAGAKARDMRITGTVLAPTSESNAFNGEALLTPRAIDAETDFPTVGALVKARPGADVGRVLARLDSRYPYGISDESRAHAPGPVRNLEQITRLPLALALFFALLGAAVFAQLLFMLARERRKDLAVLRVLGYTGAQTRGVLRSAAGSIAIVGLVIGIPLGLLAGRSGWRLVADGLTVSRSVAVPAGAIIGAALALVAFALAIAMAPAHLVLRRTPGAALRAE